MAGLEGTAWGRGCAEFCVNGRSIARASRYVRQRHEHQETRRTRRTAVEPAGQLQEACRPHWRERPAQAIDQVAGRASSGRRTVRTLGHERNEAVANSSANTRSGKSKKTLRADFSELPIEVSRDRHGSFQPQLISKHQTRWAGVDDKIISLYARGVTVREYKPTCRRCTAPKFRPV